MGKEEVKKIKTIIQSSFCHNALSINSNDCFFTDYSQTLLEISTVYPDYWLLGVSEFF